MNEVSKTAKYAFIYAIGVFLNRAVSFIMLPIYTRYLTAEDYGIIELLTMTVDVFGMIANAGLTAAVFRFYYIYKEQEKRNQVISTISILITMFYFLASTIGLSASNTFAEFILDGTAESVLYFRLIFIIFFLQAFIEVPLIFVIAQQRPLFYVSISTCKLLLQLSLNIYFVVYCNMGVLGVLYSNLTSFIIAGTVLTSYTYITVGVSFSRPMAKSILLFGTPFIISNLASFILTFSDRYFLKAYADLAVVGVYSLGYKLGFVLWMFPIDPIMNIWNPQRFEIANKPDAQIINQKVFFLFNLVVISVALGLSLFSHDLFRIMSTPEFWDAFKIVPLIAIAYLVQGWTAFVNFGVIYSAKTKYIAIGNIVAAFFIIIFSFILIPTFFAYGAAIATILAFVIRFVIIYYYSQREYQLSLPWGKCIMLLITAILIYLSSLFLKQENIIASIIFNSAFLGAYFICLMILPILSRTEKKMMYNLILHPVQAVKMKGI